MPWRCRRQNLKNWPYDDISSVCLGIQKQSNGSTNLKKGIEANVYLCSGNLFIQIFKKKLNSTQIDFYKLDPK